MLLINREKIHNCDWRHWRIHNYEYKEGDDITYL